MPLQKGSNVSIPEQGFNLNSYCLCVYADKPHHLSCSIYTAPRLGRQLAMDLRARNIKVRLRGASRVVADRPADVLELVDLLGCTDGVYNAVEAYYATHRGDRKGVPAAERRARQEIAVRAVLAVAPDHWSIRPPTGRPDRKPT